MAQKRSNLDKSEILRNSPWMWTNRIDTTMSIKTSVNLLDYIIINQTVSSKSFDNFRLRFRFIDDGWQKCLGGYL